MADSQTIPRLNTPSKATPRLSDLIARASTLSAIATAVVHPVDELSLAGALAAGKDRTILPVLIGPKHKIESVGLNLGDTQIIDVPHSHAAADEAVRLARDGTVKALMKGKLHTDELLSAVLEHGIGLRTDRRLGHVFVLDIPGFDRFLLIADAAINILPDLMAKRDITQHAIHVAHALGVETPKVAILSATEEVNPKMVSTLDAAALCKMADRGQITGALLDGPLAFDNAMSAEALKTKGISSPVAGRADVLIVPSLEAGNMLAKQLDYLGGASAYGVALGASVPIILTSRADSIDERRGSAAIAALLAAQSVQP